jgi:hypothetical protein
MSWRSRRRVEGRLAPPFLEKGALARCGRYLS